MADNTINVRIKQKIDTESNWSKNNPILLKGEKGLIEGTGKYKIGDGTSKWSDLPLYEGMTASDRSKLNGIASGATKVTVDSALSSTSTNPVQNKVINSALAGKSNTNHTHDLSTMINTLSTGTATPVDDDYYISQYSSGGITTTTYHRRPMKALFEYIKGKLSTVAVSGSYNDLSNKPTIPTVGNGTVTIKQAGISRGTFSMNQSGNATIELEDNNSWRGIQDNLTSTSTTDSLSAAQGKVLNDKFASYVPTSRTVNGKALSANISLTASDVGASASWHTHNDATTSSHGLMTAAMVTKLNGIATNANNYSLPTASSSTLGGVKTTSTVTDTSEYSPCPIVSGVPYYRNTLAQKEYTLSNISGTLAISKGGTGATSASTGRANLGAVNFVCQKEEPADGDQNVGDLWFAEE